MHGKPCWYTVFDYRVPCRQIFIKFIIIIILCILLCLCMVCLHSVVPLYGLFVSDCVYIWFVCILVVSLHSLYPVIFIWFPLAIKHNFFINQLTYGSFNFCYIYFGPCFGTTSDGFIHYICLSLLYCLINPHQYLHVKICLHPKTRHEIC
jgi:hypothetical protein